MLARTFYKVVTMDDANLLGRLFALLDAQHVAYCVIDSQAVNAYVEPLVSLDLDLVIAIERIPDVEMMLSREFDVKRFPHSLNVSSRGSDLRVQIQTDSRYADFVARAQPRDVLGTRLAVAALEDVLQGKVWAAQDPQRRGSKRQKDLADIARLLEAYPNLRAHVPDELLARLL